MRDKRVFRAYVAVDRRPSTIVSGNEEKNARFVGFAGWFEMVKTSENLLLRLELININTTGKTKTPLRLITNLTDFSIALWARTNDE